MIAVTVILRTACFTGNILSMRCHPQLLLLLVATLLSFVTHPALAQRTPPSQWRWVDTNIADDCQHHTLYSEASGRDIGFSVYLPPGYETSNQRYPVVYYLHGAGGSESSSREFAWAVKQAIADKAIQPVIYVFPNGGQRSGYRDWGDGTVMTESWIIQELIPHIDSTFRTIASRDGRALCGWSMGGGGSLRFAMKYPNLFCAAATMSAALGMPGEDANDSAAANLRRNIDEIRDRVGIWMVVGETDFLKPGNEAFAEALTTLDVDHSLTILPQTGHNLGQMSAKFHRDIVMMLDTHLAEPQAVAPESDSIRLIQDESYRPDTADPYARRRCKLDWYLPTDTAATATLVWFHGGSIRSGDKAGDIAVNLARRFCRDGFAVVSVNYRLSPKVNYPVYLDDAAAAVAHVIGRVREYVGEQSKVYVSGHSAGGYLAAMVGVHPDALAKHGCGTDLLAGVIPVSGQMITHSTVRAERGIDRSRPVIDAAAPAYHVDDSAPPFLCIVGDDDLPARSAENHYFVAAMKAAGHAHIRFVEVPGRNHSTIANQMGQPDDAVARLITRFMTGK
ncbi:Endo-1,4-beta-xylanase/feruloyl esterase precursor [Crateriforma conspicua]|nr:Endo-1,4-beta-xylanase/feruloyl esterase precursor [Crateriforma conspicua]